jgi:hypothetical protein
MMMIQENEEVRERRRKSDGFFWGFVLIALGVVFLHERTGVIPEVLWGRWWPMFLVLPGFLRLIRPAHAGHVGNGVSMLLLGAWFFAVQFEWHGLTWHNSWPLGLVAAGAGMVSRAIASRFLPERWEVRRHV